MAKRRKQFWLVIYKMPGKGKRKQHATSPAYRYQWEAEQWLKDQKPDADVLSVEPFRFLALPK